MAVTTEHLDLHPEAVFAVLADPWRFADWVVGAKRIRAVDEAWPAAGSRFHHRFGVGPLTIDDSTVLEEIDPPQRIVLRARARPTGVARVTVELVATAEGGTDVTMTEVPISGLAARLHNPALDLLVALRNRCSLRRLASLASRQGATGSGT
ncbi:MAG: hypothetical protein JWO68_1658 [Actinomycetia bacterium]|nr:hypothetical protein [Actinomycetes bacterium]